MKILFVSNLYPPNVIGGYERLCFSVAEALAARGHEIVVLTSSYGGRVEDYAGQTAIRSLTMLANAESIYLPFNASGAERDAINQRNVDTFEGVVSSVKPDVIFAWNLFFFDSTLLVALEGLTGRIPAAYFLTDNWLLSFFAPDYLSQYFQRVVFGGESAGDLDQPQDFGTSSVLAIFGSDFMHRFYADAGFEFTKKLVIHNGVTLPDIADGQYRDRFLPARYGRFSLLFAGRVVDVKGVHILIDALGLLKSRLPDIRVTLDIVGECSDAAYLARLKDEVRKQDLGSSVRFMPPVAGEELFRLFQSYDIYAFPSLYEPFALTLIHALHAGIPTVASAVGGNVEIVRDGETGAIYDGSSAEQLAERVLHLYHRPLLRKRLGRQARVVSHDFTFGRMIDRIEHALKAHVEDKAGAGSDSIEAS